MEAFAYIEEAIKAFMEFQAKAWEEGYKYGKEKKEVNDGGDKFQSKQS